MKIVFFEIGKSEKEILEKLLPDKEVLYFEEKLNEETVSKAEGAGIISVFISSRIDKNIIDKMPNLKFIATRSTGFDHIDCKYAESKGIKISSVPAYGSYTVAEFTFALILSLSRKIFDAYSNLKRNTDFDIFSLQGFDLYKKTIGVIGTGKIGKNVIKIAKGFSMNVVAYDLYPDLAFAKEHNFEYKDLSEVISQSDILTLHVPYNKKNHHLINKENISSMKKGIYIINTARGALIDTNALVWGLEEKIIAGAGLDVLEGETELKEEFEIVSNVHKEQRIKDYKILLENHVLIDIPNVIVTPHVAFYSNEAEEEIIKTTIENIKGFLDDKLINLVK